MGMMNEEKDLLQYKSFSVKLALETVDRTHDATQDDKTRRAKRREKKRRERKDKTRQRQPTPARKRRRTCDQYKCHCNIAATVRGGSPVLLCAWH